MTATAPAGNLAESGLYVHVPFCRSVCPYCDFAVLIAGSERRQGFVGSVLAEAEMYRDSDWSFDTVYLGGGTPSSMRPDQLGRILVSLSERLRIATDAWVCLEANPEDVRGETVSAWRELGVRTVSLGAQSLDDAVLRYLGRRHNAADVRASFELLQSAGFPSLSLDLIYGFEGQDAAHWRSQLEQVVALEPDHLSCYQLTFHSETLFGRRLARGELAQADEERQAELFLLTHRLLSDSGLEAYEVSSFAAEPRHRSRHNQKYWQHVGYLGLGPAAHSYRNARRWWNRKKLRLWGAAIESGRLPVEGEELLTAEQLFLEAVMLGLRTCAGVDLDQLGLRLGADLWRVNRRSIDEMRRAGLLVVEGSRIVPTLSGLAIADSLPAMFNLS